MMILKVDKLDAETEKAIGIKDTRGIMQWLAKSQIEITVSFKKYEIRVPDWMAKTLDNLEFEEE